MDFKYLLLGSIFMLWIVQVYSQSPGMSYPMRAVILHNLNRQDHQAPPLRLNETLQQLAQRCSEYYVALGRADHSCPYKDVPSSWSITGRFAKAGENLVWAGQSESFWSIPPPTEQEMVNIMEEVWYNNEEPKFDFSKDAMDHDTGHFSQMVWRATREFGFGVARSGSFAVGTGLYYPPGNVRGEFHQNVFPKRGISNAVWH